MSKQLTCDPGTLNFGWASWEDWKLVESGTWVRPKDVPPPMAFNYMLDQYMEKIYELADPDDDLDEIWVELFFPFGKKPTRNTYPLVTLVGGLLGAGAARAIHTVGVAPKAWKDWALQQDKYTDCPGDTPHEVDAVIIGLYAQEMRNVDE